MQDNSYPQVAHTYPMHIRPKALFNIRKRMYMI